MNNTQELSVRPSIDSITRCSLDIGPKIGAAGMGLTKVEQGILIAWHCHKDEISPLEFMSRFDVIVSGGGIKFRKKANAAYADFRKRGGHVKWIKSGDDGKEAAAEISFEKVSQTFTYTMDQAKKAGLVKSGGAWEKTPGNMLRARLLSNAISMLCPEIYAGEDEDTSAPEAAPLNLAATAPATVVVTEPPPAAAKPEPAPIDVVATVNPDEKSEAEMGLAPAIVDVPTLPPEKLDALEKAIFTANEKLPVGVKLPAAQLGTRAVEWLVAKGKLKAGQMLEHVSPAFCETILAKPDEFAKAIAK